MAKILFCCTSGKDRSPALVEYFLRAYPAHNYRACGLNKYFCSKNFDNYLTKEDIAWARLLVFAEPIHLQIFKRDFPEFACMLMGDEIKFEGKEIVGSAWLQYFILNCGEYKKDSTTGDDYLLKADLKLQPILNKLK